MNGSHNNSEDSKNDVTVYTKQIDHLKNMLEMTQDIARMRNEIIDRLENQLKDLKREKFVFVN